MSEIRAFLDTNVLVSAFLFKGNENRLMRKGARGEFKPLCSEYVLDEFERVLRDKLGIPRNQISSWMGIIIKVCEVVGIPREHDLQIHDEKDKLVVNGAIDGGADFLVTGDRHLLKAIIKELKVVTAREFLEILESSCRK